MPDPILDSVTNFAKCEVSTGYDASATSIALSSGEGAKLPQPSTDGPFNLTWYNVTDYPDPSDDPNVEIVRCTARSTDTLTVTRAQEGTSASTKNTSSKTYNMTLGPTAKTITDIQNLHIPMIDFSTDWTPAAADDYSDRYTVTTASGGAVGCNVNQGGLNITTTSTTNSFGSIECTDSPGITVDNLIIVNYIVGFSSIADTEQLFAGFRVGTTDFAASDNMKTTDISQIGVLFKRESGTSNLYSISANSGIETNLIDTPGAGEYMKVTIVYTTSKIEFYLDGTLVSTHTSNIPTSSTKGNTLFYYAGGSLSGGVGINTYTGYYSFKQYKLS